MQLYMWCVFKDVVWGRLTCAVCIYDPCVSHSATIIKSRVLTIKSILCCLCVDVYVHVHVYTCICSCVCIFVGAWRYRCVHVHVRRSRYVHVCGGRGVLKDRASQAFLGVALVIGQELNTCSHSSTCMHA